MSPDGGPPARGLPRWVRGRPTGGTLDLIAGVAVAAFLTLLTPVTRLQQADAAPLDWLGYALLALTALPLTGRRLRPRAAYLVGVASAVAYLALRYPGWPVYVGAGLMLVAYMSAGGWAAWPLALAGAAALGIATGRPESWQPARMLTVFVAWLAIAAFTAQAAELRRRRAEELARHRVVEERLRIAREMHDVLSHSLATISLQSGTGLHLFKTRPSEAEAALRSIRRVSNEALVQARAALATIRAPLVDGDPTRSGLDDLEALFGSIRSTGLVVHASMALEAGSVPPAIASAVYRVVQESLTNVMRHAGPAAAATVKVTREPDAIEVEVTDTGVGIDWTPQATVLGHGVMGMRERVLDLGGEFSAGATPGGGFRVSARLPIGTAPP